MKKSADMYIEDDVATKVYLIEKGKVKIGYYSEEGFEIVKSILSKAGLFWEKAILGQEKRHEFAQSLESSISICLVDADTTGAFMRNNKIFGLRIYKFIGFKFKKLEQRLQLLLFEDRKTLALEFLDALC
jgi:CRP/FNR family cyclic AMP-dependent transcriptional regulator